jgi:hypothetical protein
MEIKKANKNSQRGKNWFIEENNNVLFTASTKSDAEKAILVFNETGIFASSIEDAKRIVFQSGRSTELQEVYYNISNGNKISVMAKNFKEAKGMLNKQYPEVSPLQIESVGVIIK